MKQFGIVIRHSESDRRLFGRLKREDSGDVYVIWSIPELPRRSRMPAWNPHASYHSSGQVHSKSYSKAWIRKERQQPDSDFKGCESLEATNADRALSADLPRVREHFDDIFEVDAALLSGSGKYLAVDLVEPGIDPVRVTGNDIVLAERCFQDSVPWLVVSLVQAPA